MRGSKTAKKRAAAASEALTLADLEEQIREVAEATALADSHLDVKKGELKLKALRSLVELVNHREELREGIELKQAADRLEDRLQQQHGADDDAPFDAPETPAPGWALPGWKGDA